MLGNGRLEALCFDGEKRLAHIRGKLRKKVWINQGDIILLSLRDYQDEKGDVILKYCMFYMFLLHVLHVPFTCSACSKVMFNMYLLHVQYVQSTCSTCTFYMFSMFKGHVLHVPFACSVCNFTFTLRTSVSHNSLKSSPIYTIFIYLSSLY